MVQDRKHGSADRIAELDGLRGVAVSMVLLWHFIGVTLEPSADAIQHLVFHALRIGRSGVDLFFVLSGFLITGIILNRRVPVTRFLRHFYIRRSLRIFPPYFALVSIFWVLIAVGVNNRGVNPQTPLLWHLLLVQNWWMAEHQTLGPDAMAVTWSVAIEEQYYVLAPLLLLLLPRKLIPIMLLAVAVASASARAWAYSEFQNIIACYVLTPYRLDGLAAGGLIAWAWNDETWRARIRLNGDVLARFLPVGFAGCLALVVLMARDIAWHMFTWGHLYLAMFFSWLLVVILLRSQQAGSPMLRLRPLRFLGSISYGLYLFHPCVFGMFVMLLGHRPRSGSVMDWIVVFGALVASIIICFLSHGLIEQRLIRFGRRFVY